MSGVIRPVALADAPALAAIYDPVVVGTAISFEEVPPGPAGMQQRIAEQPAPFPWLVYERDGAVAGYAYAGAHRSRAAYRWSVDVSAYVAESARRLGIGSRLYLELFGALRARGFCAAFAGITLPNAASCALHERVGFTPVGIYHAVGFKGGSWHDVKWYQRRLQPVSHAPCASNDPS